jgi:hypothetical protein
LPRGLGFVAEDAQDRRTLPIYAVPYVIPIVSSVSASTSPWQRGYGAEQRGWGERGLRQCGHKTSTQCSSLPSAGERQKAAIDYPLAKNRVLRERLGSKRLLTIAPLLARLRSA